MDTVLINPLPSSVGLNEATIEPPLGIAYIASILEQKGVSCSIIDANALQLKPLEVIKSIPETTKLIGFYLNAFNYNTVLELANRCRQERPKAALILGGPLASAIPQEILKEIPCHGVVQGEGEYSVLQIIKNIKNDGPPFDDNVPGAVYKDFESGAVKMNQVMRIKDLDSLPFPAYHLLPPLKIYKSRARKQPVAAIITSRGCSHQCIFCSKDIFQRQTTYRSAANVLAEIDFLIKKYGIRQIDILDDNFTQKRSRVENILDGIIERNYNISLNLQSGIRTEIVDEELLLKMKRAGVYKLAFGIESADPDVLKICRKKLDLNRVEHAVRIAKKMGIPMF